LIVHPDAQSIFLVKEEQFLVRKSMKIRRNST
jgi:hypothetical protein